MKQKAKLNKILKENQIILAYLFGSEAKGLSHKESDIDIAVLFNRDAKPKDYLEKEGRLIDFFSGIYLKKEINIVNLNIASPLLKQAVILEGIPLYVGSETEKVLFQVRTLHEYEEYLHLSNIYNQFLDLKLKAL